MSLRVYAVVMHDGQGPPSLPTGLQLIPVRELAAIAEEGDYSAREVETREVERHVDVVRGLFDQDAVLPTPVGTVFRSIEVLQKWMELHYVALSDALAWVEDRVGARVHVRLSDTSTAERGVAMDLAAVNSPTPSKMSVNGIRM
jgi:hypothetical protein